MTSKEAARLKRKCLHISFSSFSRDDLSFPSRGMSSLSMLIHRNPKRPEEREQSGEQSDSVLRVNSSAVYPKMFAA